MVGLAQLTSSSSYAAHILPALLLAGVGMGSIFATTIATAIQGVEPHDSGVASAMVNTMQQVGGSVGTALLSSIFATAVSSYIHGNRPTPQLLGDAAVHGYTVAFWVAAGIFATGALVVSVLIRSVHVEPKRAAEAPEALAA
jgi:MFS family permease